MAEEFIRLRKHKEEIGKTEGEITPICVLVDASSSMFDDNNTYDGLNRMDRLNNGINAFIRELLYDENKKGNVELSIMTFTTSVHTVIDFTLLQNIKLPIRIEKRYDGLIAGDTPLGVDKAVETLFAEKEILQSDDMGRHVTRPWLAIFSDGRASMKGSSRDTSIKRELREHLMETQERVRELERSGKIHVIPVLISEGDLTTAYEEGKHELQGYSKHAVIDISEGEQKFSEFFNTFSRSVSVGRDLFAIKDDDKHDDFVIHRPIVNNNIKIKVADTPMVEEVKVIRKPVENIVVRDETQIVPEPIVDVIPDVKVDVFNDDSYLENIGFPTHKRLRPKTMLVSDNEYDLTMQKNNNSIRSASETNYDTSELDTTNIYLDKLMDDITDWDKI